MGAQALGLKLFTGSLFALCLSCLGMATASADSDGGASDNASDSASSASDSAGSTAGSGADGSVHSGPRDKPTMRQDAVDDGPPSTSRRDVQAQRNASRTSDVSARSQPRALRASSATDDLDADSAGVTATATALPRHAAADAQLDASDNPVAQLFSAPSSVAVGLLAGPVNDVLTQSANASISVDPDEFPIARPAIGVVSDVGAVAASLVNNVAVKSADLVGPDVLFGLPHAVGTSAATAAGAVSKVLTDTPMDVVSNGRYPVNYGVYDVLGYFEPANSPPGANDPTVSVTEDHPLPVILVNGTFVTQDTNWSVGAPVLANAGYKVYTFNYGNNFGDPNFPVQATQDVRLSGKELSDEIDWVLAETGAEKVILVGHSQGGGILPAYYINEMGGADKVSQVIGIAPSNHGTNANGLIFLESLPLVGSLTLALMNAVGPALTQQLVSSPFQDVVYGNGDTRPGVQYTNIITVTDWVVTPYHQQPLDGPNVVNIVIQDDAPDTGSGHGNVILSPVVWDSVLDALESNPEANPGGAG